MTKAEALQKIKAVKAYMTSGNPIWDTAEMAEAFDIAIEALSAADQERKTGKWIYPYETTRLVSICSECGSHGRGEFCQNCGAKMLNNLDDDCK